MGHPWTHPQNTAAAELSSGCGLRCARLTNQRGRHHRFLHHQQSSLRRRSSAAQTASSSEAEPEHRRGRCRPGRRYSSRWSGRPQSRSRSGWENRRGRCRRGLRCCTNCFGWRTTMQSKPVQHGSYRRPAGAERSTPCRDSTLGPPWTCSLSPWNCRTAASCGSATPEAAGRDWPHAAAVGRGRSHKWRNCAAQQKPSWRRESVHRHTAVSEPRAASRLAACSPMREQYSHPRYVPADAVRSATDSRSYHWERAQLYQRPTAGCCELRVARPAAPAEWPASRPGD